MNLSPARLAVIVALVVGGVAVLLNGFELSTDTAAAGGSPSPSVTVSPLPTTPASPTDVATDTPAPETDGVTIMVFNGTSQTGLAGIVQQDLQDQGYDAPTDAANALSSTIPRTTVYFRVGADEAQNEANATYMAEEFLDGAVVKPLGEDYDTQVDKDIELVVVVGNDYPGATG